MSCRGVWAGCFSIIETISASFPSSGSVDTSLVFVPVQKVLRLCPVLFFLVPLTPGSLFCLLTSVRCDWVPLAFLLLPAPPSPPHLPFCVRASWHGRARCVCVCLGTPALTGCAAEVHSSSHVSLLPPWSWGTEGIRSPVALQPGREWGVRKDPLVAHESTQRQAHGARRESDVARRRGRELAVAGTGVTMAPGRSLRALR